MPPNILNKKSFSIVGRPILARRSLTPESLSEVFSLANIYLQLDQEAVFPIEFRIYTTNEGMEIDKRYR